MLSRGVFSVDTVLSSSGRRNVSLRQLPLVDDCVVAFPELASGAEVPTVVRESAFPRSVLYLLGGVLVGCVKSVLAVLLCRRGCFRRCCRRAASVSGSAAVPAAVCLPLSPVVSSAASGASGAAAAAVCLACGW